MNDLFDQQIIESLHRNANHAVVPRPSFGDVRRRVRIRRQRNMAAIAAPAVLGIATLGLRSASVERQASGIGDTVPVSNDSTTTATEVATTSMVPISTTSVPVPLAADASLHADIARRVELAQPSLAALGFPNNDYSIDADGVTTLWASDPNRPSERTLTMTMRPGIPEVTPTTYGIGEMTGTIAFTFQANDGWMYTVEVVDTSGDALPTEAQLLDLRQVFDA